MKEEREEWRDTLDEIIDYFGYVNDPGAIPRLISCIRQLLASQKAISFELGKNATVDYIEAQIERGYIGIHKRDTERWEEVLESARTLPSKI